MSSWGGDTRLPTSVPFRWLAATLAIALGEPLASLLAADIGYGATALAFAAGIALSAALAAGFASRLGILAVCAAVLLTPPFAIALADYVVHSVGLGTAPTVVLVAGLLVLLVCARFLTRRDAAETVISS